MTLVFRPTIAADLPEMVDLWVASWSEVYAEIDFEARRGWFVDHMEAWRERGGLSIAAFDPTSGAMAGFFLLNPADGHLDQICVRKDLKGRGAAHRLMAQAMRLSPGGLHLDVNQMNSRAIAFYERLQFIRTGEGVNPTSGLPIFHYRWRP